MTELIFIIVVPLILLIALRRKRTEHVATARKLNT